MEKVSRSYRIDADIVKELDKIPHGKRAEFVELAVMIALKRSNMEKPDMVAYELMKEYERLCNEETALH